MARKRQREERDRRGGQRREWKIAVARIEDLPERHLQRHDAERDDKEPEGDDERIDRPVVAAPQHPRKWRDRHLPHQTGSARDRRDDRERGKRQRTYPCADPETFERYIIDRQPDQAPGHERDERNGEPTAGNGLDHGFAPALVRPRGKYQSAEPAAFGW